MAVWLSLGHSTSTARLWDLSTSPITSQELKGHTKIIRSVAFSHDSRFALTGSDDTTARLWDLTAFPITSQELTGHTHWVRSVAFSPDKRFALTGSHDKTARLWDLTKSPITFQELSGHSRTVAAVAFSPDGQFGLTGSFDATIRLWNLSKSPITCEELLGHTDWVHSVAFSPDGSFALTGSIDRTARLWDLRKSQVTSQMVTGHTDLVASVAFSPDGRFALTGSYDKTARLWRVELTENTLSVEDSLLMLKLNVNDTRLKNDPEALNRLQQIMKEPEQHPQTIKLIADYLYRIKLPEQECWICTEKYDPESRICMLLSCCKKQICKVCLDKLREMSYSSLFEGHQFEQSVQNKCPFCNKPANQMGIIRRFNTDPNNHHCSTCDKEECTFRCGACKTNYYCSKECQAKDWLTHKATCKKK